ASGRWGPVGWVAVGATAALVLTAAFWPGPLGNHLTGFDIPNPLGVASLGAVAHELGGVALFLLLASIPLAVVSLVVRLCRARGVELQQLKWFAYCAILLALLIFVKSILDDVFRISSPTLDVAFSLGTAVVGIGLPVATGLAILRYRLFDIDVLIRRTLIYGTLTALLAGIYFGLVIGAQAVVQALTGQRSQPPVLLVATTLLIAALVNPLRRAVQATID